MAKVRFQSIFPNYTVVLTPTYKKVENGFANLIRGKKAVFKNGIYETSDEVEIKRLREIAKRNKNIWEIDEEKVKRAQELSKKIAELKREYEKKVQGEHLDKVINPQSENISVLRGTTSTAKNDTEIQRPENSSVTENETENIIDEVDTEEE